jgi:hypothetical protein
MRNDKTPEQIHNELLSRSVRAETELEALKEEHKPLRKAYLELLDLAMHYRERMGIDNKDFEYDWMEKAGLL